MSQKGVKECSAGFQPAEGLLQTKSLPSSTCRQDAGATISSRLLSPARRFAPETSVVRQKSFNIILPRSDRMGQEGGAEGIAKLRSGFWKAFRARPITIKTRGTIAQWRLLWHLASSGPRTPRGAATGGPGRNGGGSIFPKSGAVTIR